MRRIERYVPAPPALVFSVLEDPRSLRVLVAGARRIRRFDPSWPDPGSTVHHTVGIPPLIVRDTTLVLECQRDRRLVLEARVQIIGVFLVDFRLSPAAGGTDLVVEERVVRGLLSHRLLRPLADVTLAVRNVELARRLHGLVVHRQKVLGQVDA